MLEILSTLKSTQYHLYIILPFSSFNVTPPTPLNPIHLFLINPLRQLSLGLLHSFHITKPSGVDIFSFLSITTAISNSFLKLHIKLLLSLGRPRPAGGAGPTGGDGGVG